jgi:hypothetical protein
MPVLSSLLEGTVTPPDLHTPKHVDAQYHPTSSSVDDENITLSEENDPTNQMLMTQWT